jgi:hypothetical protein
MKKPPSFLLLLLLIAPLVIELSAPLMAQAAQAGGLPTLTDQVTVLQGSVATLSATVLTLQRNNAILQEQITALQNAETGDVFVGHGSVTADLTVDHPTVVASVTVPAGSYLIQAVVPVVNLNSESAPLGACGLSTAGGPELDVGLNSGARAAIQLPSLSQPGGEAQIPLVDTATFATDTTITVSCAGVINWTIYNPTITALRIRSLQ